MKLKLHRDKVISIVHGKDLVGVYVLLPKNGKNVRVSKNNNDDAELLLAEMHPKKADAILKLWNNK